jgi:tetratricopeptide (TPR) repeat protein
MKRFLIAALLSLSLPLVAEVKVWQGVMPLPTHQEGTPNPNPPFDVFESRRFNYPYTLRDTLSGTVKTEQWRALFLENEYLRCSVLPDVGGHLYNCVDKINGADMFYANPSLKKALISYRGAWSAFGVEFNFPVSHNWATLSPVDFASAKNPDGSASIWVANTDRVYGLRWNVKLTLRPGSTVLEQRVTLSNPSELRHRYYWWNNAAMQAWNDTLIEYPQNYTASHGFKSIDTWPVNQKGRNLRIVGNHVDGPVSEFAHASREPFMGVYHPKTSAGTVHYSEQSHAPTKKIWAWGVDEDGLRWRDYLSDNNSAYVEVQAGLFRNQETFAFLEPLETIQFTEYWMPVREIGGITRANLHGVVHITDTPRRLGLNVHRRVEQGRLQVLAGSRVLVERTETFTPEKTVFVDLPGEKKLTIRLVNASGETLLEHTEGVFDMAAPGTIQPGPQSDPPAPENTDAAFWMAGNDLEVNGDLLRAWDRYQEGLQRFPGSFLLLRAAGSLAVDLNRFDEARDLLQQARERVSNDGATLYSLGIAYTYLGDSRAARTCLEQASTHFSFRAAALRALAGLDAQAGNKNRALDTIREARRANGVAIALLADELMLSRVTGNTQRAEELTKQGLSEDPSNSLLRWEAYRLGLSDEKGVLEHLAADSQRLLGLARAYMRFGLYEEVVDLLSRDFPDVGPLQMEPGEPLPGQNPLVRYYLGYARMKMGAVPDADFAKASTMSLKSVFPRRAETLVVLEEAIRLNPNDSSALALLGHLRMAGGLQKDAVDLWTRAASLRPAIPALHRSLGWTLLHLRGETEAAAAVFREGQTYDPENADVYLGLNDALLGLRKPASERAEALKRYPDVASAPVSILYPLALSLAEANRGAEAFALFQNRFFPSEELGLDVRTVFVETRLLSLLARARAGERIPVDEFRRVGEPLRDATFSESGLEPILASSRSQYLLGLAAEKSDASVAQEFYRKAVAAAEDSRDPVGAAWALLAAKRLSNADASVTARLQERVKPRGDEPTSFLDSRQAYMRGMRHWATGNEQEAAAVFRKALQGQDKNLGRYLSHMALSQIEESQR